MSNPNDLNIAGVPLKKVDLDESVKAFHIKSWGKLSEPKRMAMLRQISREGGRDPRVATKAIEIIREAGVKPRDYRGQAAALLTWVQENIYYANEPGERLQDPVYTLRVKYGDCDDEAILLAAFYESLRLPWRFVLSGKARNGTVDRWVEGSKMKDLEFSHIYVVVGWPPFRPTKWQFAEPTLKNIPLGWDVVHHARSQGSSVLPELAGILPELAGIGVAGINFADAAIAKVKESLPFAPEDMDLSPSTILSDVRKSLTPRRIVSGLVVSAIFGTLLTHIKKKKK
jgi:hypothetical protein